MILRDTMADVRKSIYYSSGMYHREMVAYKGPMKPDIPYPKWFKK